MIIEYSLSRCKGALFSFFYFGLVALEGSTFTRFFIYVLSYFFSACMPTGLEKLFPDNNLQLMVQSGAKGSMVIKHYICMPTLLLRGRRLDWPMSVRKFLILVHMWINWGFLFSFEIHEQIYINA